MLFDKMVSRWSNLPELKVILENPDIIVPLDYGILIGNRLPAATADNLGMVLLLRRHFPKAMLVFGNSSHCFPGSDKIVFGLKLAFASKNPYLNPFIDVGPITNTVTEAEKIKDDLKARDIDPKEIILVTGQMHAPYAVLVWKYTFPNAKIALVVTSYQNEYQPEHIILLQRYKYPLFATRVLQYNLARHLGVDFFRKIQHPVSKTV